MARTHCAARRCTNPLPAGRRKFCTDACSDRERASRYYERNRDKEFGGKLLKVVTEAESEDGRGSMRRGDQYDRFAAAGGPSLARENGGRLTHEELGELFGVSRVTVTHWMAAYAQDKRVENERGQWQTPDEAAQTLEDFKAFRDRYFRLPKGEPYITADFHLKWIKALLAAIESGGQLAILSPPRHGKTELLVHTMVWLICRNPNIRIIWVGGNEDIAANAVGLVMAELETNERLIADFCGPGAGFKPASRTGKKWTASEFTVATRTVALKSPTMVAVGKGGKLLSRDADILVGDDIEDDRSTAQPAQREATWRWFNKDLASRKEEHTAWLYIGSCQHPEDLVSNLRESAEWEVIVEQVHDDDCVIPAGDVAAHVDCMLFPQVRSYKWAMQKRRTVGDAIFEMQYLNRPRSDGLTVFPRETVEESRDFSRVIGDIPPHTRLIVGLDPSGSSGFQGAILQAIHTESNTRFVVDIENVQGGGVVHMRSVLERWTLLYPQIEGWAIEENIVKDTLEHDQPIRELRQRLGIQFIPHNTGRNKWHLRQGIPGLAEHFRNGKVNLPYGDLATRERVEPLINQLANFSDSATSHQTRYKTDLVMALWFPETTIQRWVGERVSSGMAVEYVGGFSGVDGLGRLMGGL